MCLHDLIDLNASDAALAIQLEGLLHKKLRAAENRARVAGMLRYVENVISSLPAAAAEAAPYVEAVVAGTHQAKGIAA